MLFHTSIPHILHKKCSSCISQYPTFVVNCKALPTIPNVLHKLQNLAHNTQHSSQIAKPCSYSTINPNTRFTKRKICICYCTQYPTFFTNGKGLVAIPHQYGILQKQQKPRCYSRATTTGILHQKTSLPFQRHPILLLFHTYTPKVFCKTLLLFHQHSIQDLTQQRYYISAYRKDIHFAGQVLKTVIKSPMMLQ